MKFAFCRPTVCGFKASWSGCIGSIEAQCEAKLPLRRAHWQQAIYKGCCLAHLYLAHLLEVFGGSRRRASSSLDWLCPFYGSVSPVLGARGCSSPSKSASTGVTSTARPP